MILLFTQLYTVLLTCNPSSSIHPHVHMKLSFSQLLPRTKHPAIVRENTPRNFLRLSLYISTRYTKAPGCPNDNLSLCHLLWGGGCIVRRRLPWSFYYN